jgi:methylphosphotriester-DNA--protein-cysteine methyltransferase
MYYKEFAPPEETRPWVECLWVFHAGALPADAPPHVIVPDGAVSLAFLRPSEHELRVGIAGPSCRAHRTPLTPHSRRGGIRLRPGAAGSVLGIDIRTLRDYFGPLAEPLPEAVARARAALARARALTETDEETALAAAARAAITAAAPPDAAVCAFAAAIMAAGGDVALGALASGTGLGPRQLRRRFLRQCGLSPKEFARLRRVRQACVALVQTRARLAEAALTAGFADQPHMSREFRDVFRNSAPMVRDYLRQITHGGLVAPGQ